MLLSCWLTALWNLPISPPKLHRCWDLVDQELLILVRSEETTKGVFLHQGVDPLLGQVKGRGGDIHQVPQGHIFGEVINVYLWWDEDRTVRTDKSNDENDEKVDTAMCRNVMMLWNWLVKRVVIIPHINTIYGKIVLFIHSVLILFSQLLCLTKYKYKLLYVPIDRFIDIPVKNSQCLIWEQFPSKDE